MPESRSDDKVLLAYNSATMARTIVLVFLLSIFAAAQNEQEATFPTKEEIDLVVTQAERAFEQYNRTIELEKLLPSFKKDDYAIKKDTEVYTLSMKLVSSLKGHPERFHGLGGLLLLSSLDDASRNAVLCSSSGMGDLVDGLLKGKLDKSEAYQNLHVAQTCQDASTQLYTVSENVHALLVREMEAQQQVMDKAMIVINQCKDAMKSNSKKQEKN